MKSIIAKYSAKFEGRLVSWWLETEISLCQPLLSADALQRPVKWSCSSSNIEILWFYCCTCTKSRCFDCQSIITIRQKLHQFFIFKQTTNSWSTVTHFECAALSMMIKLPYMLYKTWYWLSLSISSGDFIVNVVLVDFLFWFLTDHRLSLSDLTELISFQFPQISANILKMIELLSVTNLMRKYCAGEMKNSSPSMSGAHVITGSKFVANQKRPVKHTHTKKRYEKLFGAEH